MSQREDSAKSYESFTTAHAGFAGSGDENGGWSDGGDRHGPLRDMASGPSYRRADLGAFHGPKHSLAAHAAAHSHAQDDDSVSSSRSRGSSASGSGSTVSSQSSRSSSSISFSSGGGWARRLSIWKRSRESDGNDAGAGGRGSTVDSLEDLHHLTIEGQHGGGQVGAETEAEKHAGAIWVVRASPDGQLVATGGQCGLIGVWHVATEADSAETVYGLVSRPLVTYGSHTGAVLDLAWSRDLLLLSASVDLTVRLWHASSPYPLRTLADFAEMVTSVLFHPINQQLIFTGCLDGTVSIFDLRPPSGAPGTCVSRVQTQGVVTSLAISGYLNPKPYTES